jgi:protein-L-isoaspartate(D-aspartate) O-methyltransferase
METNDELVDYLRDEGTLKSNLLESAFRQVDRGDFTPDRDQSHREGEVFLSHERNPYLNEVYPLTDESTVSQPTVVAKMLELLEIEEGQKVLEIGSGSGYQAAVMSKIADEVVGIEIDRDVAEYSRRKLQSYSNIEIVQGAGLEKVQSSFDRIIFSCAVEQSTFDEAKEHLNSGGRMIGPVGTGAVQEIRVYDSNEDEEYEHGKVRFVRYQKQD